MAVLTKDSPLSPALGSRLKSRAEFSNVEDFVRHVERYRRQLELSVLAKMYTGYKSEKAELSELANMYTGNESQWAEPDLAEKPRDAKDEFDSAPQRSCEIIEGQEVHNSRQEEGKEDTAPHSASRKSQPICPIGEFPRARSQSVSVPCGGGGPRMRTRSHSFKSPPVDLGGSPSSFKAYWSQIKEGTGTSFKEPTFQMGDCIKSYGQTTENLGASCGEVCSSFKAPPHHLSGSQMSFKCPPDRGNAFKSFKTPIDSYRSQEKEDEDFHDILFPLRTTEK